AKRIDGALTLWQKDDKVWIELKPGDFDKPFLLSPKLKTGIGERMFYGGLMRGSGVVEFRKVHNQVQLVWANVRFTAAAGSPEAHSIAAGYSPSLLASAPLLSLPEPERKSVLIEANAMFLADLLTIGQDLQRTYRQGYAFDARNSAIVAARGTPDIIVLEVLSHFAAASIGTPQLGVPPGVPQPSAPRTLRDPRSMFMTVHYSIARLPEEPMHGRRADQRVGYFESGRYDFTDNVERTPRVRYVNRWRLEKKNPDAALSEPLKPVTFWLDKSIPLRYRASITAGVLEWNKAFEKIGFKDALRVEVQPDNAEWDTLDFGRASLRWMTNSSPSFGAIGPSHTDPRSGEILDADIGIESLSSRNRRSLRAQVLTGAGVERSEGLSPDFRQLLASGLVCTFAEDAGEQLAYATDVLEARGDLDPAGPEAEAFVQAYMKDVTMHEVGHTLGLRHNFRASRVYTLAQLADPVFTKEHGTTGSVMDYAAINLNGPEEVRASYGTPFSDTLGPYDYWAIEYAYRPLPSGLSAADERAALEKIAGRSAEPLLAYGTDEDNFLGIDPESLQGDLGNDVVAFAKKRIAIAQDLLRRQETRDLKPNQDYNVLQRSVRYALVDIARVANALSRQVGGVRTVRDMPGTGRDPLTPVPFAEQRAALDVITGQLLSAESFSVSPALQRRFGTDFAERTDALFGLGDNFEETDFSLSAQVLGMQRSLLAQLLSDTVATRLLESTEKSPSGPARALRASELYGRLTQAVWSELHSAGDIAPMRREIQRDHVNRIAILLLRPALSSRADTRSLVRSQAKTLLASIHAATRRGGLSEESRAHLQDSADTLEQALSAKLLRATA
ncbi:MAG: zinc-dependent metalloprotease, partial [Pseudomonadota bacterium]|nr:zinc-dependent metalloprotease [Pseudomonadota bacterium]